MRKIFVLFVLMAGLVMANILPPSGDGGGGGGVGDGDMKKATYDTNSNGVVDNAEKAYGKTEVQLKEGVATETDLIGKADVGHKHIMSDITDSETILAGKSSVGHTHNTFDVVDFFTDTNMTTDQSSLSITLGIRARKSIANITIETDCEILGMEYAEEEEGESCVDGDVLILRISASGSDVTPTFKTNVAGSFAFGSTLTADDIGLIEDGKMMIVGCQYHTSKERWLIMAISEGF